MAETAGVELSHAGTEMDVPRRPLLLFELDDQLFACDVEHVREVIPYRRATPIPRAPAAVCGIINLRGSLVTVLDIATSLGGQHCERTDGLIVLVSCDGVTAGIGIDDVRDIEQVPEEWVTLSPRVVADGKLTIGKVEMVNEQATLVDLRLAVKMAML